MTGAFSTVRTLTPAAERSLRCIATLQRRYKFLQVVVVVVVVMVLSPQEGCPKRVAPEEKVVRYRDAAWTGLGARFSSA
jgi:hypothetical protein